MGGNITTTMFGAAIADFNNDGVLDIAANDGSVNRFYLSLQGTSGTSSMLPDVNLTTQSQARDTLAAMNAASARLSNELGSVGAQLHRLEFDINHLRARTTALAEAESRIESVDIAEEVAGMIQDQIRQQAISSLLQQHNLNASLVLSLLADG